MSKRHRCPTCNRPWTEIDVVKHAQDMVHKEIEAKRCNCGNIGGHSSGCACKSGKSCHSKRGSDERL